MKTKEQLRKEAGLEALKILPFLRRPGVFIRRVPWSRDQKYEYEAIKPGDWLSFESQPIKSATFQVLLEDQDIQPVHAGSSIRWTSADKEEK